MLTKLQDTPAYAAIDEYLHRLHEPAFGKPHAVAEPHVALDGSRVVVTGSVFDELVGRPRTDIYTVIDGELRALTSRVGSARWGRFSPEGETLAFLSDRTEAGVFQLFLLEQNSDGEACETPAVPGTVEYAHWSPDGARILLGVAGLGADLSGGQGSGTNARSADHEQPAWFPLIDEGVADSAWRSLWLYTPCTNEIVRLSAKGLNHWEADWCGPRHVVAVTSEGPCEDDWYSATLTLIDTADASSRDLLRSGVQLGLPTASPDGRYVSVVEAVCSDRGLVAGDVVVIDLSTGARKDLDTAKTDVTWLQWLDGARLGYVGQRHLDSVAGIVDVTTDQLTELLSGEVSCGASVYPSGSFTRDGRVLLVQSAYDLPPQVALVGHRTADVLVSTAHAGTDYLMSIAGRAEPVTWFAHDDLEIEGILCRPEGEGPFPLIVNLHGGPIWAFRNMWSMWYPWVPILVSRGYAVLNPNPRGSSGRGQAFAERVVGDMGGADAADILSGVDALVQRGVADPERIGLIGRSYGGFMAAWLVTQDQRFAAAVPISPATDWYSIIFTSNVAGWARAFLDADPERPGGATHARSPVLHGSKVRTPCLNVAGANDRCTPPGQAEEFHRALCKHGVDSMLAIYPQEGHHVASFPAMTDFLSRIAFWFELHIPVQPSRCP